MYFPFSWGLEQFWAKNSIFDKFFPKIWVDSDIAHICTRVFFPMLYGYMRSRQSSVGKKRYQRLSWSSSETTSSIFKTLVLFWPKFLPIKHLFLLQCIVTICLKNIGQVVTIFCALLLPSPAHSNRKIVIFFCRFLTVLLINDDVDSKKKKITTGEVFSNIMECFSLFFPLFFYFFF